MGRLKLRTFSIALILVSATLGMQLDFTSSFLAGTGASFDEESEVKQLRGDFAAVSDNVSNQRQQAQDVSIQTDFFFLAEVWNIMQNVVSGAGDVLTLIGSAAGLTGLNIPQSVLSLGSIIIAGVVFAVVAAARGWDV